MFIQVVSRNWNQIFTKEVVKLKLIKPTTWYTITLLSLRYFYIVLSLLMSYDELCSITDIPLRLSALPQVGKRTPKLTFQTFLCNRTCCMTILSSSCTPYSLWLFNIEPPYYSSFPILCYCQVFIFSFCCYNKLASRAISYNTVNSSDILLNFVSQQYVRDVFGRHKLSRRRNCKRLHVSDYVANKRFLTVDK